MQLIVQPDDGVFPILKAIRKARRTIDKEIEKALAGAVTRGVVVRTLISHTSGRGEKPLRKLEQRLLEIGATVSRTADDLLRYHGKMMIVDGAALYVMGFNFAHIDVDRSRSLGVVTRKPDLVSEATRLFEADFDRKPYTGGARNLLVSPVNARERLAAFLKGAKRELLIYDSGLTDNAMIKILRERVDAGVELRIIGKVEKGHPGISAQAYPGKRLPVRTIVRDGRFAFVGSQSLRKLELDARREVGVVIGNTRVVRDIIKVFEADWVKTAAGEKQAKQDAKQEAKKKDNRRKTARRRQVAEARM
jgi:cardiolipin synthase